MARSKEGPNRSEAIRDLLTKHPEMGTKDVVDKLNEKGLDVKPGLVYLIRGKMKDTSGGSSSGGGGRSKASSGDDPVAMIRQVKALAAEAGGLDKLKDLVDVLAE